MSLNVAIPESAATLAQSRKKPFGVPTEELIKRHQAGQPAAFDALFDRYKDYVYRVAYMTLRNSDDAEEATQEAFLDVLRGLRSFDVEGAARFETWVYRVTVNRCKTRLRKKRLPSADWDELEERLEHTDTDPEMADGTLTGHMDGNPEEMTLRQEDKVRLWHAVNQLSDSHREVVMMRYAQEFSYEEIADALEINIGTVKSRLFNAHKKLQEILTAQAPDLSRGRSAVGLMLLLFC
ncbi:MAG: sigma-70 family RNA polymerase sigma factor [Anaerolineae bacterium]